MTPIALCRAVRSGSSPGTVTVNGQKLQAHTYVAVAQRLSEFNGAPLPSGSGLVNAARTAAFINSNSEAGPGLPSPTASLPPSGTSDETTLDQQKGYLTQLAAQQKPCDPSTCLAFASSLTSAEQGSAVVPSAIATTLPIGNWNETGKNQTGALIKTSFNAPAFSKSGNSSTIGMSGTADLTIALFGKMYDIATLTQSESSDPTGNFTVILDASMVPQLANANPSLQRFHTVFKGLNLEFNQSSAEQQVVSLCPNLKIPISITGLPFPVSLTASAECTGSFNIGYQVQATPTLVYATIGPTILVLVHGQIEANAYGVIGDVDGYVTVANFVGRTGFLYGLFPDLYSTATPAPTMILYKPFGFYAASAFNGKITASISFLGIGKHTIPVASWQGVGTAQHMSNVWYVVPLT